MASKKAGGTAKNLNDSNAQYLGVKLFAGQKAIKGNIIVRQRGTRMLPGLNVGLGKDHTIFSLIDGIVSFRNVRKNNFNGTSATRSAVDVTPLT
ncbi:MAG: large subunit ribosomal protein [Patescibacteria group bacterium]|nr:large subunit ribosomal protein [Patescibacteria group bacterium]